MAFQYCIILSLVLIGCLSQRSPYAGRNPVGYPVIDTTTEPAGLGNRFGSATTQRLPVDALGDRNLVNRLSRLPIDKQPFWFINWRVLEAYRQNPQTYEQRPNPFIDPNGGFQI